MNKILGIFGLLVFVCLFTSILNPDFVTTFNIQNTLRRTSYYGIISIGAAMVIVTGGIDLSIGSAIGLIGCLLSLWLAAAGGLPAGEAFSDLLTLTGSLVAVVGAVGLYQLTFAEGVRRGLLHLAFPPALLPFTVRHWQQAKRPALVCLAGAATLAAGLWMPALPLPEATRTLLVVLCVLEISVMMGLMHGFLITRVGLQPFIVTLCGLLIYRGLARWLTDDRSQGFGREHETLRSLATGRPCTMSALFLVLGGCLLVWALVRWSRRRAAGREDSSAVWAICPALVGAALLGAGGLHYAQGAGGIAQGQASWAQLGMYWTGAVGLAAGLAALHVVIVRRRLWKALAADGAAAAGCALIALVLSAGSLETWSRGETWFWGLTTAAGLSAALAGASWLLRLLWRDGGSGLRTLIVLTVAAGVLLMTGLTPMDRVEVPAPLLILIALTALAAGFLNGTIYGRYLLAVGRNEQAARFSGVNTQAMVFTAYVISAVLAGIAGILFSLDVNSLQPSGHGNFYELYAIAAAVLGGCSLRGGEGSMLGVVIGAAVMQVLYNAINILGISTQLEYAIIGGVILAGVVADDLMRRINEERSQSPA